MKAKTWIAAIMLLTACAVGCDDKAKKDAPKDEPAAKTGDKAGADTPKEEDKGAAKDAAKDVASDTKDAPKDDAAKADGKLTGRIVYTKRNSDDQGELFVVDAAGGEPNKIYTSTDPSNANIMKPKWSDDGKTITFAAMREGKWGLWSISGDGTGEVGAVEGDPDMTTLKSHAEDIVVKDGKLMVKNEAGEDVVLYKHIGYDPKLNGGPTEASWGPGKTHVVFQINTVGKQSVHIASVDGKRTRIASGRDPDWK